MGEPDDLGRLALVHVPDVGHDTASHGARPLVRLMTLRAVITRDGTFGDQLAHVYAAEWFRAHPAQPLHELELDQVFAILVEALNVFMRAAAASTAAAAAVAPPATSVAVSVAPFGALRGFLGVVAHEVRGLERGVGAVEHELGVGSRLRICGRQRILEVVLESHGFGQELAYTWHALARELRVGRALPRQYRVEGRVPPCHHDAHGLDHVVPWQD